MKKIASDVVVVAGGIAGLAASIAAAEKGIKVILFEKESRAGGQANFGGGIFGVETRVQRQKQYPLTREEAFRIYMDFNRWNVDGRLVKTIIDRSADTMDWLESMGIEFDDISSHGTGNHYTWHLVKVDDESKLPKNTLSGHAMFLINAMIERANALGIKILLKTPVDRVLKEKDRVVGVIAKGEDGSEIEAQAKAVIMATGAYGSVFQGFLPGTNGDGIRMAKEVGASVVELKEESHKSRREHMGPGGIMAKGFLSLAFSLSQPCLLVNLLGERFIDENVYATTPFGMNAVSRQKDGIAFNIFDEDTKNIFKEKGFDYGTGFSKIPITKASNFDEEIKQVLDKKVDGIYVADSIEELADQMGIDKTALKKTIDEYNYGCDTGQDPHFNKQPRYLRPVRKPKFYASKQSSRVSQWPGIKVNYRTEIITEDHKTIPGFYGAGIDISPVLYYDIYPNVLPGNAMGFAVNTGRIAGENAADYVTSLKQ